MNAQVYSTLITIFVISVGAIILLIACVGLKKDPRNSVWITILITIAFVILAMLVTWVSNNIIYDRLDALDGAIKNEIEVNLEHARTLEENTQVLERLLDLLTIKNGTIHGNFTVP